MAIFRSYNDIVISLIEYLRLSQPELDTKPGTVSRDLFIDAPSQQLAELYSQLRNISNLQSLFSTTGSDLSKLASNFNVSKSAGTAASGSAVFTTNNLDVDILIPMDSIVVANNGINFRVTDNFLMKSSNSSVYRGTATRLRTQLDLASITDQFAVEVLVEALSTGTSGNIGIYSLISHSIAGISNVTNLQTFSGGSSAESDGAFKSRVLSVFAGSNTGTALGYTTVVDAISGVSDSMIVVPGDPLLVRDGTQVVNDADGDPMVSEAGSGGKVDIYVLGSDLESQVDSFIYNDQSGKNNPEDVANDVILGQRGENTSPNVAQRRVALVGAGNLPYQPVYNVVSVSGSASGPNFVEKYTDSDGRERGNYELIKDTGDFGGSSFGFDRLRWISDKIELDGEEVTKGITNGIDELGYPDVQEIRAITQDFLVTNENATTGAAGRNYIILNHTPIRRVSRITNLTTGERYVIEDQNPDGTTGGVNTSGRVVISGRTLPVSSDVLQADYTWIKSFDSVLDFDNLSDVNVSRLAQDSVDWGFGNLVQNEPVAVVDGYGELTVTVTHPIQKVITVNSFETYTSTVSSGIVLANKAVTDIVDIRRVSDNAELYNTDSGDGVLYGTSSIVLPSDTIAVDGDAVIIRFNPTDLFTPTTGDAGTFLNNIITLPDGAATNGTQVLVNYVASVPYLLSETNMVNFPVTSEENVFVVSGAETGNQPTSYMFDSEGNITNALRRAPSNLRVTVGSIVSGGSITVLGTTAKKVTAVIAATSGSGYEVDLRPAILADLGLSDLPSTIMVSRLYSIERVNLDSSNNVESVDNTYDVVNYKLNDNSYDINVALQDTSIGKTQIVLPQTTNNISGQLSVGDAVRVTFYYTNTSDSEVLYFSKNCEQVTDKVFASVSKIYVSYGFKNSSDIVVGTATIRSFNQPANNTMYSTSYDYTAPKENERITVTFNYNAIINTITESIEDVRPITADVLAKEAAAKDIDISIKIILSPEFLSQEQTIIQDATDAVTSFLTAGSMGTTIDASDVINTLYTIQGIDRVRILSFSYSDMGNLLSISADRNEYLRAGTVNISTEER